MAMTLPEPTDAGSDIKARLLDYLDYFRSVVARKLGGLDDAALRSSRLPSGWTPLELAHHLAHMERRWMVWGFRGEPVADPWGDSGPGGGWAVPEGLSTEAVLSALHERGEQTRRIAEDAYLETRAATGGRFPSSDGTPPTLAWILFHVFQEYARHVGHLDIVRELIDGEVGE